MEPNVRITYAIIATPIGKGYACFAIRHERNTTKYAVSSSYCHPSDRKIFSKKEARIKALSRLNSDQWTVELEHDTPDFATIIQEAAKLSGKTPNWALRSIKNGAFKHTLANDRFTADELCHIR